MFSILIMGGVHDFWLSLRRINILSALGESNEPIRLVRESDGLLLSPESMQWQQIDLQAVSLPDQCYRWGAHA